MSPPSAYSVANEITVPSSLGFFGCLPELRSRAQTVISDNIRIVSYSSSDEATTDDESLVPESNSDESLEIPVYQCISSHLKPTNVAAEEFAIASVPYSSSNKNFHHTGQLKKVGCQEEIAESSGRCSRGKTTSTFHTSTEVNFDNTNKRRRVAKPEKDEDTVSNSGDNGYSSLSVHVAVANNKGHRKLDKKTVLQILHESFVKTATSFY